MATRFRLTNTARRFMATGLSLAITLSCADSDEVNDFAQTHAMNFGVALSNEWHTPRKADARAEEWDVNPLGDSTLWLVTSSEPNTRSPFDRAPKTRGSSVNTDNFYNNFYVYAYAYKGADWSSKTDVVTWFANDKVSNNNGIWVPDQMKYWPGETHRMRFFAYAPHPDDVKDPSATKPEDAGSLVVSLADDGYTPTLTYNVPTKVTAQKDLVVAGPVDLAGNYNKSVDLQFEHILTAVKVKAAYGLTGTIKRVALTNIASYGTYNTGTGEWNVPSPSEDQNQVIKGFEIERDVTLTGNADGTPLNDGEYTFMMIPQLINTAGSNLEITINDGSEDRTISHTLSGIGTWEKGKGVTYLISDSEVKVEYTFSATNQTTFTGEGGTNPIVIQSFKTANGLNPAPVTWENGGYYTKTEAGEYTPIPADKVPDWLLFPTYEVGQTNYNVDVYHQYKGSVGRTSSDTDTPGRNDNIIIRSQDKALQKMEFPSDGTPVNLAGSEGSETTANCYIVNGPGWYKFPIVYGNALINGAANSAAYNGTCFVNHLDQPITQPWIKDNGITVTGAKLLWQDCPDSAPFIGQVSLEGDYIKFQIPAGNTCVQGNAIIAATDAAGVVWSWHIWLTTHQPNDTFQFGDSHFFKALLGYREAELAICPEREVYVKLVQSGSGNETYVHVSQDHLYQFVATGNAPYYQYGRKDPFPGASLEVNRANGKYSVDMLQDRVTDFKAEIVNKNTTLGYAIQRPDTFIGQFEDEENNIKNTNWYWYLGKGYDTYNGSDTGYKILWDNGVKTVYDPCPAGYKIPTIKAMKKVSEATDVEYVNTGIYFINNKGMGLENEQRFFLQILCSRGYDESSNSEISKGANASIHCSDGSNGSTQAHYLLFNGTNYWVSSGTICAGRCILPQKE